MNRLLRNGLASCKPLLERAAQMEAAIAARWAAGAHRRLYRIQWGLLPQPEYFDHRIDLYYLWPVTRQSFWLERGVFGSLALTKPGRLLELACGDGFNARHFYSLRCDAVVACDIDPIAIARAERYNRADNITYVVADIRRAMPAGAFDHVAWDAAIEHFTVKEIQGILGTIGSRLSRDGVLSGHTIVARADGIKALSHHEYEFKDKDDLMRVLSPYFANVTVFETHHPGRHNLYFWASNGLLPFHPEWPNACSCRAGA